MCGYRWPAQGKHRQEPPAVVGTGMITAWSPAAWQARSTASRVPECYHNMTRRKYDVDDFMARAHCHCPDGHSARRLWHEGGSLLTSLVTLGRGCYDGHRLRPGRHRTMTPTRLGTTGTRRPNYVWRAGPMA